jgi:hypothetical protein
MPSGVGAGADVLFGMVGAKGELAAAATFSFAPLVAAGSAVGERNMANATAPATTTALQAIQRTRLVLDGFIGFFPLRYVLFCRLMEKLFANDLLYSRPSNHEPALRRGACRGGWRTLTGTAASGHVAAVNGAAGNAARPQVSSGPEHGVVTGAR